MIQILLALSLTNLSALKSVSDSLPNKYRAFKTTVVTNASLYQKGYFYTINDSTISLTASRLPKRGVLLNLVKVQQYNYSVINTVEMKRVNSVGRGALLGALIGIGSGVAAGFIEGDDKPDPNAWFSFDFTAGQKAVGYGILLGVTGTIVGLIIGAVAHKKFTINGRRDKFQNMKADLLHQANRTSVQ